MKSGARTPAAEAVAGQEKAALRLQVREHRRALDAGWVAEASEAVARRVRAMPEFARARTVACYLALPGEVRTERLLESAWRAGKRVCVPACRPDTGGYALAWLDRGEPVATPAGRMAREPAAPRWVGAERLDLALVPGVAFDRRGARLGHGGGHYDRLLARTAVGLKVGLAFEWQIAERLPAGPRDVPMDRVVSERAAYGGDARPSPATGGRPRMGRAGRPRPAGRNVP
jgi:5-formyltetrahydrofolate cyclo-ligase